MAEETVSFRDRWKKRLTRRNIFRGLLVYFALKLCGVFQFYGPYWGRVVDAETGQPIPNAGVAAEYTRTIPVLSGPMTVAVQEAFTDESGYFFLWPRFVLDVPIPFYIFQWTPELKVLKERYSIAGTNKAEGGYGAFCTVYGIEKVTPTSLGLMNVRLSKLKVDYKEYKQYSSDLEHVRIRRKLPGLSLPTLSPMAKDVHRYNKMVTLEQEWVDNEIEKYKIGSTM